MGRRLRDSHPRVFDEDVDISDGPGLGIGVAAAADYDAATHSWQPGRTFAIRTPSGEHVVFSSIEVAREVQYVLNGLTLEGKL